jgi:CBS domain-containing protein
MDAEKVEVNMTFLTGAIMSSNLVSISEERDIETAQALMKMNKIRHLPVVDSSNELSGIISVQDLAKAHNPKSKIKSVMTSRVRVVKKTANIKSIIEQMLKFKISSMIVAHEQDVVGIVTTDDLLKLLYQLLEGEEDLAKLADEYDEESFFDDAWKREYEHPLQQQQSEY